MKKTAEAPVPSRRELLNTLNKQLTENVEIVNRVRDFSKNATGASAELHREISTGQFGRTPGIEARVQAETNALLAQIGIACLSMCSIVATLVGESRDEYAYQPPDEDLQSDATTATVASPDKERDDKNASIQEGGTRTDANPGGNAGVAEDKENNQPVSPQIAGIAPENQPPPSTPETASSLDEPITPASPAEKEAAETKPKKGEAAHDTQEPTRSSTRSGSRSTGETSTR